MNTDWWTPLDDVHSSVNHAKHNSWGVDLTVITPNTDGCAERRRAAME